MIRPTRLVPLALFIVFAPALSSAQDPAAAEKESYIRLHYSKQEVKIKMKDGVELFTAIFTPKDTTKKDPILIKRTPYSVAPDGPDKYPTALGPSDHFAHAGYISANQGVRGPGRSAPESG